MRYFVYFERLGRIHENKVFFLFFHIFVFAIFHRKSGILIPDLYFYSIKYKPILSKIDRKIHEKNKKF
jgi:hypothetical protein